MHHAEDRVVISPIDRAGSGLSQRVMDAVVALFQSDRSNLNVECLSDETRFGAANRLESSVDSDQHRPLIAVIHWENGQSAWASSAINGNCGTLVGIDLSLVGHSRRGVALASALHGLSRGTLDVIVSQTERFCLNMDEVDSACIFVTFQHEGVNVTAITQHLRSLDGILGENVAPPLQFEVGLPLNEVCFTEKVARSGFPPSEPFRRTLKKLQSLGVACHTDSSADRLRDLDYPSDLTFRLAPGWTQEGPPHALSIVISCNDPAEPNAWLSLSAVSKSGRILAVANSLLGVVATAELEWQRWLA